MRMLSYNYIQKEEKISIDILDKTLKKFLEIDSELKIPRKKEICFGNVIYNEIPFLLMGLKCLDYPKQKFILNKVATGVKNTSGDIVFRDPTLGWFIYVMAYEYLGQPITFYNYTTNFLVKAATDIVNIGENYIKELGDLMAVLLLENK